MRPISFISIIQPVRFLCIILIVSSVKLSFGQDPLIFDSLAFQGDRSQGFHQSFQPKRLTGSAKSTEMVYEYHFSGALEYVSHFGNRQYDIITIPGFSSMSTPGKPALPLKVENVLLPGNARVHVEVIDSESHTFTGYMVQPALTPATDTEGADPPQFVIDQTTYNTNDYYPANPVYVHQESFIRGNKVAGIAIAPVQFNPVTGTLRVYTRLRYRITYDSGLSFQDMADNSSPHYLEMYRNIAINEDQIPKYAASYKGDEQDIDYIIVTHNDLLASADSLALWRSMTGYRVEIISSDSWTSAMVKDSIHNRYHNATNKPEFFVILGDHNHVPAEIHQAPNGNNFATDLYYACMDGPGDFVPDMAHGRISVNSPSQAMETVLKIINYERTPVLDPAFYNNSMNCTYYQGFEFNGTTYTSRRFLHTSEEARDYLLLQGYNVDRMYTTPSNINPQYYNNGFYSNGEPIPSDLLRSNGFQWDAGPAQITNGINEGRFLVMHRDHGYQGGWGWVHPFFVNHPSFNNVQNLSNGDKLPVVFSINCHSGDILQPESFAETFLRHSQGGAVGLVAPTFTSYSGPNDGLALGLYDAIWSQPGLIPDFGSGGVSNPPQTTHDDILAMGHVLNQALIRMVETWPGHGAQTQYTHEVYHFFGDPAMKIRTNTPTPITASVKDTIRKFQVQVKGASIQKAMATITYQGRLIARTMLNQGQGVITFSDTIKGNATLTISASNTIPHIQTIYINNHLKDFPPSQQARNISFNADDAAKSVSLNVSWEPGDGDYRLVKINNTDQFTDPVDGVEYQANNYYQHNGEQVVYVGEGSQVTVYNLNENEVYWFRVYEYNNDDVNTIYTTKEEFGNPTTQTDDQTFPVSLISFRAEEQDGQVRIVWETASEVNNDRFLVEHKCAGQFFNTVEVVPGGGSTWEHQTYMAIHREPCEGVNYYRLTQEDFDGSRETFTPIAVHFQTPSDPEIHGIEHGAGQLSFSLSRFPLGDLTLDLYAIDGRLLQRKKVVVNNKYQRHALPISGNSQSTMIIRATSHNGEHSTRKIAPSQW